RTAGHEEASGSYDGHAPRTWCKDQTTRFAMLRGRLGQLDLYRRGTPVATPQQGGCSIFTTDDAGLFDAYSQALAWPRLQARRSSSIALARSSSTPVPSR